MRLSQRAPLLHSLFFQPFGLQENAVLQTYILSMGAGGFGTYLTGMGYQAYRNLGGAPRDSPDFNAAVVYDPIPSNTMPYLVLTSVLGAFMLTQLRKLMIIDWRLPFPSGTASGIMLNSFHTAVRGQAGGRQLGGRPAVVLGVRMAAGGAEAAAARLMPARGPALLDTTPPTPQTHTQDGASEAIQKVKVLSYTGVVSFAFSVFKWFFQGTDYSCGFAAWPTFGFAAMKYTWNFDWQLNYVGAGGRGRLTAAVGPARLPCLLTRRPGSRGLERQHTCSPPQPRRPPRRPACPAQA
jgi:uncharacterized oligopeptide transporter (OPT) family protein